MRTNLFGRAALIAVAATLCAGAAPAQLPTGPGAVRVDPGELRGLASVPADAESGFAAGAAGPVFAGETTAVIVRFRAPSLPAEDAFSIAWLQSAPAGAPRAVRTDAVARERLGAGAYAMLTNFGKPLAPGDYQVTLAGASGRIYGAVDFEVRRPAPPPRRALAPTPPPEPTEAAPPTDAEPGWGVPYAIEDVGFLYPRNYAARPITGPTETGSIFRKPNSAATLFVFVKKQGSFSLGREATALRTRIIKLTDLPGSVGVWRTVDLPPIRVGGREAPGRLFTARDKGRSLQIVMHVAELEGRGLLLGYATVSTVSGNAAARGAPTDAAEGAEQFYQLVSTLRRNEPQGPATEGGPLARK